MRVFYIRSYDDFGNKSTYCLTQIKARRCVHHLAEKMILIRNDGSYVKSMATGFGEGEEYF